VSPLLNPQSLFRRVAIAEAVTWALLLTGMALKCADVTELGVRVFGMLHGVVFIAYCLATVLVGVDQRWSRGRLLLGLVAAVPPFATVLFDRYAERRGALATDWRLRAGTPAGRVDALVAWIVRNPLRGAAAGVLAVLALTGLALLAGPPAG
jgi:integral membrane protein